MRILIADDNELIRKGFAGLLAQHQDWETEITANRTLIIRQHDPELICDLGKL